MDKSKVLTARALERALREHADPARAKSSAWFFQTGKGGYAEGDRFLGIRVPVQRAVARHFRELSLQELSKALRSPWHEMRLTALIIAVHQAKHADAKNLRTLAQWYLKHTQWVNNWDLVDTSAEWLLGAFCYPKHPHLLLKLARSKDMWERRIAMIATSRFIREGRWQETVQVATLLRNDPHDLIQKAVGWMLREMGSRVSKQKEEEFLRRYAATLPRTALRYAIEHFSPQERKKYLSMKKTQN